MNSEPNLYFDRTPLLHDFAGLLYSYKSDEFASPYRSTVPLLALVRDNQNALQQILTACKAPSPTDFYFEFKVDHQSRGRGKASHTDLMVASDTVCVAIEAKWTEPPYESVASWLSKGTDQNNRKQVLDGWLALLSHGGMPLSYDEAADCEYQMLHRAASARATAATKKTPMLTYLKFTSPDTPLSASSSEHYRTSLALLRKRLRPNDFPFFLVEIKIAPTDAFKLIENLSKGSPTTGISVQGALLGAPLFKFLDFAVEQIGN